MHWFIILRLLDLDNLGPFYGNTKVHPPEANHTVAYLNLLI